MSKKYLEIGEHGLNGDFYACDGGPAFRADNLVIATKIAFNNWLHDFDPLYRKCSLKTITEGTFTIAITNDGEPTYIETHTVAYYGPGDMFTAESRHAVGMENASYAEKYHALEAFLDSGDPRVRRSKRSGLIMFNINFPRYDKNGEWWSSENSYLYADLEMGEYAQTMAEQQMEYALSDDDTRALICTKNSDAMRAAQKKMFADMGYVPKNEQTGTCNNCGKPLFNNTVPVHNHGELMATLCTDCGLDHPEIVSKFYNAKQEVCHD